MRTVVVIPAFNEERTVAEVVRNVREHIPDVVVVDDGSSDATEERARGAGAIVVRHCVNRGLGAALGTGIAAALHASFFSPSRREGEREGEGEPADIIVTMDADGQHDPAGIAALVAPIARGEADVVIGTRFLSTSYSPPLPTLPTLRSGQVRSGQVAPPPGEGEKKIFSPRPQGGGAWGGGAPWTRRLFNAIANMITHALFGVRCSDTQSGFRCFSRHAAEQIEIRTNRMEVSSEILAEAVRRQLRIAEVPIRTIYTDYSLSKGQSFAVGIRTAWALMMRKWF